MVVLKNPHRGTGLPGLWDGAPVWPSADAEVVAGLLQKCPAAAETPLVAMPGLAGIGQAYLKDETARMGLGSFKALGAAYAIAREAEVSGGSLDGRCYIAASAGNHGLSVAAGAGKFGARAVIVLAETVPESFADRLRSKSADVVRTGATYEDSMAAAMRMSDENGWTLLSDSTWPGYVELPYRVMEGYLQMASEAVRQIPSSPTHVFLQAGVGGMAAAVAAYARVIWGDGPRIIVVEPEFAPALLESIKAGRVVVVDGPVSAMGRLDCKEPSLVALTGLARDADVFMTVSEAEADAAVVTLADGGICTTPSGAAGVAGLMSSAKELGVTDESRGLFFVSESGDGM